MTKKPGLVMMKIRLTEREIREGYEGFIKTVSGKTTREEKRYAVFLPLILVNDDWHVLYEVRSQHISQPGEVSFPGDK
ncbi:hypothetical protein MGAS2096_Spy1858 [Streptococcus pyogenes MGAS2096]|nr:hypothetical protein MGAS2096_Spy1858 [Streptococcus pyogenes MGAS2096]